MDTSLTLTAEREGELVRLVCPAVGEFTCAVERGRVLTAGQQAGVLVVLGRSIPLLVPEGVSGVVRSKLPEEVHAPVDHGAVLYELSDLAAAGAAETATAGATEAETGTPTFRCEQTGRYWHRSSPSEPPLIAAGQVLEPAAAVGLIEVMKTFTPVRFQPAPGGPERVRVLRVLKSDGADVRAGDGLFEYEGA